MKLRKRLSASEISSFCSQVAMLLNAGITPTEGMAILLEDTSNNQGRQIIQEIYDSCSMGNSFHESLRITEVFPDYVLSMVALGEESGTLDVVVKSLADYYEKQDSINDSIHNAVSYPFVMLGMMVLVILVLITKVLPIFQQVYAQLGSQMNGLTTTLLHLGSVISRYSIFFIILFLLLVFCYIFCRKTTLGRQLFLRFATSFFLTKHFFESIAASRFASGIALTLSSGMDTYTSLDLVAKLVDNKTIENRIALCKQSLIDGDNFAEALTKANIFNKLYSRMVSVGFRTGSIDGVMKKIADNYEKEIDHKLHRIISVLEPTLVIILSFVVGLILLSVILPLMGIMSSIG